MSPFAHRPAEWSFAPLAFAKCLIVFLNIRFSHKAITRALLGVYLDVSRRRLELKQHILDLNAAIDPPKVLTFFRLVLM